MDTTLYKYLPRKFAEAAAFDGEFRLGTLYEFRRQEAYDPERADPDEGLKQEHALVDKLDWHDDHPDRAFVEQFIAAPSGMNIRIENSLFLKSDSSPDLWLYCTSSIFSGALFRTFTADACLAIPEPSRLLAVLSRELIRLGLAPGMGTILPCVYATRQVHYTSPHEAHPAAIKDPRYREQAEVRFVWDKCRADDEPVIIHAPDARAMVRLCFPADARAEA